MEDPQVDEFNKTKNLKIIDIYENQRIKNNKNKEFNVENENMISNQEKVETIFLNVQKENIIHNQVHEENEENILHNEEDFKKNCSKGKHQNNLLLFFNYNIFCFHLVTIFDYNQQQIILKTSIEISENQNFKKEDMVFLEILGEGGFGMVQKVYYKRTDKYKKFMALKTFKNENEAFIAQIKLEDNLLKKVEEIRNNGNYDYFLEYYGICKHQQEKNKDSLFLLMESGICTLDDILKSGKIYQYDEILYVLRTLVKAFAVLQSNGIANRDLKAENIILVENDEHEGQLLYKISDFGISCVLPLNNELISCKTIIGISKKYIAPEIIEFFKFLFVDSKYEMNYNPYKSDVYSLGIIVLKMMNYSYGIKKINDGLLKNKEIFIGYENLLPLLERMLEQDPNKRIDFKGLDKLFDEKIDIEKYDFSIKVKDEWKYYLKSLDKKEEKQEKTIEGIKNLYDKHMELFLAYENKLTLLSIAKYHLKKATKKLNILKDLQINGVLQSNIAGIEIHLESDEIECLDRLGNFYMKMGKLKKSEEILNKALKCCENLDEKIHAKKYYFSTVFVILANLHQINGNLQKAEEFYRKALEIKKLIYGKNHEDTVVNYNNLASLYRNMGNLQKAEKYYLKALNIMKTLKGENHEYFGTFYNNLAELYLNLGNLSKSEEFYRKSLEIMIYNYGENHGNISAHYLNFSKFYEKCGNFEKSKECIEKSVKISENIYGFNHAETNECMISLGSFYENIGDFLNAEKIYLKCMKIAQDLYGEDHVMTAACYTYLGSVYRFMNDLLKAEEFLLKALRIFQKQYGENNENTANCYGGLGSIYTTNKKFKEAEDFLLKSLKINQNLFGEFYESTCTSYNYLGMLYSSLKRNQEANESFQKSYQIAERLYGSNHKFTQAHLQNLNDLNSKISENFYEKT